MLEILNTVAAMGTFVVISATAIAAVAQLRHLRTANQLQGLLTVLSRVEDANFNEWMSDTQRDLPVLLNDPEYVRRLATNSFDRGVPWLQIGNSYDWVGSLVKNGLIPEDAFLDVYCFRVVQAWELLIPMIVILRDLQDDSLWENFEYLYVRAQDWIARHQRGSFPKNMQRVQLPPVDVAAPLYRDVVSKL